VFLDGGLNIYGHTQNCESEEADNLIFRVGGSHAVQETNSLFDVFGQHQGKYMFCSEHLESVHGGAKARELGGNKTSAHVFEGEYSMSYLGDGEVKL
jgi:hypothetical protein